MRRIRLRITVRGMIVAVALVALGLGAARLALRRVEFLRRAEYHANAKDLYEGMAQRYRQEMYRGWSAMFSQERRAGPFLRLVDPAPAEERARIAAVPRQRETVERCRQTAHHHAALQRKYERAASRPWEPVAPDPDLNF